MRGTPLEEIGVVVGGTDAVRADVLRAEFADLARGGRPLGAIVRLRASGLP